VVKVLVAVGDVVAPGSAVMVLEAMKMENELATERGGTVKTISKQAGQAVDTGDLLVELV
jgi:biotin carboxyl carrier protein